MTLIDFRSAKITKKGQISIPKEIRELENFKEGSKIVILAYDDRIELRSMDQLDEKISTALASEKVLKKEWDTEEEDEAWKDL
ncbi:transcriptional regulator, AbrB family [Methanohalobium evestigatum Z-7303]|uniref:Transcriptional regulator, AbrB family n=1 Tax=Methanohalobium evestigatum (strain ATCC BAA-1072 / DSM 3721 / NBRC 107634 / OCM 161 / Z-7303) TaxID=644295 RepID=D7E7L0_METEZ|nr:AbrB/MazE/SpoVT family DNA-binding domain-containing protein [Methanohalobium evestigatum]ADI74083.1 transcriptional regulator, AbrB family [Methanohalobium evestigatum Z-7303]